MLRGRTRERGGGGGEKEPAQASANTIAVQQNWNDRDFLTSVQLGVSQLSAFLNDFDATTRGRLAKLDGKLSRLERRMQAVEATLHSVDKVE